MQSILFLVRNIQSLPNTSFSLRNRYRNILLGYLAAVMYNVFWPNKMSE